jgi:hypothetical protein
MPNSDADILRALDGPGETYPPFNHLSPYPKFLVVNIYGGYTLTDDKLICITNEDQTDIAERLKSALVRLGFSWKIRVHQPAQGSLNVGVQFDINPTVDISTAYQLEIENYAPWHKDYQNGIISLVATDLSSLEKGVDTLIQVIQLAFERFGEDIASLWIRD